MRRFGSVKRALAVMIILVAASLLAAGGSRAQTDSAPIDVHLTFTNASVSLDDPDEKLNAVITVRNVSGSDVLTREGFSDLGYHLYLIFKTDDKIITSTSGTGGSSSTPSVPPVKVHAENLPPGWVINMDITEVRDYFPLTQPGQYSAWVSMPFVEYDSSQAVPVDDDGDGIVDWYQVPYDAVIWAGSVESNTAYITLTTAAVAVTSDIRVKAVEYVFGEGSHPGVTRNPLTDIEVRLYERSAIDAAGISLINHRTCGSIATNGLIPYQAAKRTVTPGEYIFKAVGQDDYVIIGHASRMTDYKHMWSSIGSYDPNWGVGEIVRNLFLMAVEGGKKSPSKSYRVTGSELLIIEPEYVEWTGSQEVYPFAFESLGDWSVTTSVSPPEGFVADHESLSEDVNTELEAVQFTITDVGSKWEATEVNYTLKHKGKEKKIKSKIDVKLSKKLAKEKGVGEWGEDLKKGSL